MKVKKKLYFMIEKQPKKKVHENTAIKLYTNRIYNKFSILDESKYKMEKPSKPELPPKVEPQKFSIYDC